MTDYLNFINPSIVEVVPRQYKDNYTHDTVEKMKILNVIESLRSNPPNYINTAPQTPEVLWKENATPRKYDDDDEMAIESRG